MPPLPPARSTPPVAGPSPEQQRLYDQAATTFGPALARLAAGYERDPHRRQDLLQDVHFALWRSLAAFDGRCALRTWVYRVAHNVAASHALRDRRRGRPLVALDALDDAPAAGGADAPAERLQRTRRGDAALAATDRAGLAAPSLLHYRAALVRERDRFTGRRLWLPFAVGVPGGLLLLLGVARQVPALRPYVWLELGAFAVAMPIAVGVGRRRARRVQARLDDLDALTGCA